MKQFPFTTRYSFVCYFLFPFAARFFSLLSLPSLFFLLPLLYSGSRSLSNFTLDSAPPLPVSSLFRQRLPVSSFFLSLFFFTTPAFVQSVNTSNEVFLPLFLPRVFFASLSTRPLLSQLPLLRRVCRRPPHPRVRRVLRLLCQYVYIYMYIKFRVQGGGKSTKNFNASKIRRKEKRRKEKLKGTRSKFRVESKFIQSFRVA